MKILIVGCGAQGSVIATELSKTEGVNEMKCVDIDLQRAKWLARMLRNAKAFRVDAGNLDELTKTAKGVDLVVNATLPKYNMNIMEAALKSDAQYLDMASGIDPEPYESLEFEMTKQFDQNNRWKDRGLTALLGGGISPGTTNVLAAYAAYKLDKVNEIHVRQGYRMLEKPLQEFSSAWCPEILWTCTAKPVVFENGKLEKVQPFTGEEIYTFPDPVGQCTTAYMLFAHEEVISLPRFIGKGINRVDIKAFIDPMQKAIFQLGLLGTKSISVKDVKVAPRDLLLNLLPKTPTIEKMKTMIKTGIVGNDVFSIAVGVKGEKAGKKINYIFYVKGPTLGQIQKKLPGANCVSYLTGTSASIFSEMLVKKEIRAKGAFPPECLEPRALELFIAKTSKYMEIYETAERYLD